MNRLGIPIVALSLLSCSHQVVQQASRRPMTRPEPRRTDSVHTAMDRQVRNALDLGDGDIEIQGLRRAILANPTDLPSRLQLANRYMHLGSPELAIEHYRFGSTFHQDNVEVQLLLAKSLYRNDMADEAILLLDRFVIARPDAPSEVYAWIGFLRDMAGDYRTAELSHRQAITQRGPAREHLHNNLGYNLLRQGRAEEAAAEFRLALEIAPRSEVARNNLGLALASSPRKARDEALVHWKSIAGASSAHNNLAAVLIQQGQYSEARKQLDLALRYNPKHSVALRNLALVSELDGKPAILPVKQTSPFWKRVTTVLSWIFLDQETAPPQPGKALAANKEKKVP